MIKRLLYFNYCEELNNVFGKIKNKVSSNMSLEAYVDFEVKTYTFTSFINSE